MSLLTACACRVKVGLTMREAKTLQELKRDSVREAVCSHAGRLFLEKGFADTTIDHIAQQAGISRRTFFRYFESKEAVVLWRLEQFGQYCAELARARPAGEAALEALENALIEACEFFNRQPAETIAVLRLTESVAELRGPNLEQRDRWSGLFAEALERRRTKGESTLICELAAAVGLATMTVAVRRWLQDPQASLTPIVRKCFGSLGKLRDP
jgi:AcrR family transcriptional regulator